MGNKGVAIWLARSFGPLQPIGARIDWPGVMTFEITAGVGVVEHLPPAVSAIAVS